MPNKKIAEFGPERQKEVRAAQIPATEMLFDLDTARVFLTGRRQFDISETVMSITLADAANLCAQMVTLGANILIETSKQVVAGVDGATTDKKNVQ